MDKPRLKTPRTHDRANNSPPAAGEEGARPVALSPLNISGVVVKKKDLVEALRIYVPTIADIQAFEDGEHFYLILGDKGCCARAGDKD